MRAPGREFNLRPFLNNAHFMEMDPLDDDEEAAADAGGAAAAALEAAEAEAQGRFESCPLETDQLEREMLGQPDRIYECFGCEFFGDDSTSLPNSDIEQLKAMARERYGSGNRIMLAQRMAEYYAAFRQRINANLLPGEQPLPEWNAAQILAHLKGIGHHNDPMVVLNDAITETREIRERLKFSLFERNTLTLQERVNKVALDGYEKMTKLLVHLQSKDPTKMAFADTGGERANPENFSQGIFSTKTKQLHGYWGKK